MHVQDFVEVVVQEDMHVGQAEAAQVQQCMITHALQEQQVQAD